MDSNYEFVNELRPEYDFSKMKGGVRGKYVERYRGETNIVLLDPDVPKHFPPVMQLMRHFGYSCRLPKDRIFNFRA